MTVIDTPPIDASVLDGLLDPVILVDQAQVIVDCNRAAKQLLGGKAVGTVLADSLESDLLLETVVNVLGGQPGTRTEVSIPFPVSRTYELNVWRLPGLKSKGPAWAMVVLHDVTAAQMAEQMRADFVSNVSHELRSPLSSLLGFIETLRGPARQDAEATHRFLGIMEAEAKRMTRLINDLLILSKVESDEHIRPEGTVDVMKILTHVASLLSARAGERSIKVEVEAVPSKIMALGDVDQLIQVFQNLMDNAIGYGRAETAVRIAIDPSVEVPGTGEAGLSVAVINQGEGIPPDDIPRLTERFYRVDKGRSRSMGGTGLGLAIVKHIVARHRGYLDIDSAPGGETVFKVYLPSAGNTAQ